MEHLRTKITFIKNKFHVRLLEDDMVINEMACRLKQDTGYCSKYMLRWYHKLGGMSVMAESSRHRQKGHFAPIGKVWYEKDLRSCGH